jgi:RND family efflux transporter MFP subunit
MKTAIFVTIAAVLLIAFSCSNEGTGFFARFLKGGGSAVPVTVESVVAEERAQELHAPATIEPAESVEITLPEDVQIESLAVTEGTAVGVGDVLLHISERDMTSRLARVRTDLKDAQSQVEKNSYLLRNRDRLLDEGKIDKSTYDSLDSELETSTAAVDKLQQEIARIEERSTNPNVTSPIAGVVGKLGAVAGLVVPAGRSIMTIVKADPALVAFRLPSHDAQTVKAGMSLGVRFPDLAGETAFARVTSIGTQLDPADNTFAVKATVLNPNGRYKTGMNAEVQFQATEKQRFFLIPEEALLKEQRAFFVFVVIKGVAHKVQVIPNQTVDNRVEIARGLKEEDLVVVKGNDKLTEGTVVDIWGK